MRDLLDILRAYEELKRLGRSATLATLVHVKGSFYRRPGSRLLITDDGRRFGLISAGCVENDLCEKTRDLQFSPEPKVITYDSTAPEDIVWGLGLGCSGIVQILAERIPLDGAPGHLDLLAEWLARGESGVIATVYRMEGPQSAKVASRLMLDQHGNHTSVIDDPAILQPLLADCRRALAERRPAAKTYHTRQGAADVLIEVIQPPLSLLIFGAGPDAAPLVDAAAQLGWKVTVVDHRPAYAVPERFPAAGHVLMLRPEELAGRIELKPRTVAVIMTHHFLHDRALFQALLPSSLPYIGLLGPRRRRDQMIEDLRKTGLPISDAELLRLHNPAGLDIGADTPQEIALSIIAEIQAVLSRRDGGFLRDRDAPIHDPLPS